jgi:hypothetical protein
MHTNLVVQLSMISARLVVLVGVMSGLLALVMAAGLFLTGLEVFRLLVVVPVLSGALAALVGFVAVATGRIKNDLK